VHLLADAQAYLCVHSLADVQAYLCVHLLVDVQAYLCVCIYLQMSRPTRRGIGPFAHPWLFVIRCAGNVWGQ
jgi:hypothetical protein